MADEISKDPDAGPDEPHSDDGNETTTPQPAQCTPQFGRTGSEANEARKRREKARERQYRADKRAEEIEQRWPRPLGFVTAEFLRLHPRDRWSVTLQFLTLFAALCVAAIYYGQWATMDKAMKASRRPLVIFPTQPEITVDPAAECS